ncbi:MAG: cytochrome-c oxidase [Dehalococcoidia bacterium]|nr:cytochrome-c oxidase [Dehalococcoidia bacterium]
MQVPAENRRLVKFLVAAAIFFAWATIQGALQAQQPIYNFLQGPARIIIGAHVHVGTLGWISLTLWTVIYYLLPMLGKPIAWPKLINWNFWIFTVAVTITAITMITVGIRAGNAFAAGAGGPQLEALMGPYMMVVGILSIICGLVSLLFTIQILVSASRK